MYIRASTDRAGDRQFFTGDVAGNSVWTDRESLELLIQTCCVGRALEG